MKIVKFAAYQAVIQQPIPLDEDRAIADFRGFYPVAHVHCFRVQNIGVIDTLLEVVDRIRDDLITQRKKHIDNTP